MIAIIDYGMGNLRSVQKGFEKMGYTAEITRAPHRIETAPGVVLPGVGAFGACMDGLHECGSCRYCLPCSRPRTPLLGICVGMQILFSESIEFGRVRGLDILKAGLFVSTRRKSTGGNSPHGWNQLHIKRRAPHLEGVPDGVLYTLSIRSFSA